MKGRILIVDDEMVVRDSLDRLFADERFEQKPLPAERKRLNI